MATQVPVTLSDSSIETLLQLSPSIDRSTWPVADRHDEVTFHVPTTSPPQPLASLHRPVLPPVVLEPPLALEPANADTPPTPPEPPMAPAPPLVLDPASADTPPTPPEAPLAPAPPLVLDPASAETPP